MTSRPTDWPEDHAAFRQHRQRWLDGLAADRLLREVGGAAPITGPTNPERPMNPIHAEGDLCILTASRRLVLSCFTPQQRDLADVIRVAAGVPDAFGVVQLGPVRITVQPVTPQPAAQHG